MLSRTLLLAAALLPVCASPSSVDLSPAGQRGAEDGAHAVHAAGSSGAHFRFEQLPVFDAESEYTTHELKPARGRWRWPSVESQVVVNGSISMRGLFARVDIEAGLLIPYVGNVDSEALSYYTLLNHYTNFSIDAPPSHPLCQQDYCVASLTNEASAGTGQGYNSRFFCPTGHEAGVMLKFAPKYFGWDRRACLLLVMSPVRAGEELFVHYGEGYQRLGYVPADADVQAAPDVYEAMEKALEEATNSLEVIAPEWLHEEGAPALQALVGEEGNEEWVDAWVVSYTVETAEEPGKAITLTADELADESLYRAGAGVLCPYRSWPPGPTSHGEL